MRILYKYRAKLIKSMFIKKPTLPQRVTLFAIEMFLDIYERVKYREFHRNCKLKLLRRKMTKTDIFDDPLNELGNAGDAWELAVIDDIEDEFIFVDEAANYKKAFIFGYLEALHKCKEAYQDAVSKQSHGDIDFEDISNNAGALE